MPDPDPREVDRLLDTYLSNPNRQNEERLLRKMHTIGKWGTKHWTDEVDLPYEPERWLRCAVIGEMVAYLGNVFQDGALFGPFDPACARYGPTYADVLAEEADDLIQALQLLSIVKIGFSNSRTLKTINDAKGKKVEDRLRCLRRLALEARKNFPNWEDGAVRAHIKHKDREIFGVPYTTAWRDAFRRLKLPPK